MARKARNASNVLYRTVQGNARNEKY